MTDVTSDGLEARGDEATAAEQRGETNRLLISFLPREAKDHFIKTPPL